MTDAPRTPTRAPAGLAKRSRDFWHAVTAEWVLRPDELAVLETVCRNMDIADQLAKALKGEPLVVVSDMGAAHTHPLLRELRQYRTAIKDGLRWLNLPDPESSTSSRTEREAEARTAKARKAAMARWSVPHGASA